MENTQGNFEQSGQGYAAEAFQPYQQSLMLTWSKTLTVLGWTLVPIFFVLDFFTTPSASQDLLPRFGVYRLICTAVVLTQYFFIRFSKANRWSFLHGYFFNFVVSAMIVTMTVDLGGFDSGYYAGLNLVLIAVNLLMPWAAFHSAVNGIITILMYVTANALFGEAYDFNNLINNLYFMSSTVIISGSINYVKFKLVKEEFFLRQDLIDSYASLDESRRELKEARDALWGEMEIAKRIQTALLPDPEVVGSYEVAAAMLPANEVGGDYYDIIETDQGDWLCIGDVSGHGVESGLIMMMTQTSIRTMVENTPDVSPARVLGRINNVIKENISRLGTDRYMTLSVMRLKDDEFSFAGRHQDIPIIRAADNQLEVIQSRGTWIGIMDDVEHSMVNITVPMHPGDVMLLFTDGATEAMNAAGDMFGDDRLHVCLRENAHRPAREIVESILKAVTAYQEEQDDDITLVVIRRRPD